MKIVFGGPAVGPVILFERAGDAAPKRDNALKATKVRPTLDLRAPKLDK